MSLMTLNNVISFSSNSWLAILLAMVSAYLIGSMNWAIIITRLFAHEDIRKVGSGNAGATNVLRSQGVFLAILTLIGDVGKGILAAFAVLAVILDQVTKYLVVQNIPYNGFVAAWPGVFHLTHLHNTGMAFSMLEGGRWFFLIMTAAAFILLGICLKKKWTCASL